MEPNIQTPTLGFMGTGRRKNAVARVRVMEGTGKVSINGKTVEEFFGGLLRHKRTVVKPIEISAPAKGYDYMVYVDGGDAGWIRILWVHPIPAQAVNRT